MIQFVFEEFENNVDFYIRDVILDFDDTEHYYIAEKPKVHTYKKWRCKRGI